MVAEERITTKFSGLVGAYGSEEEATFLATQQVDEARHMQFYARFQDEVIADPQAIGAHVERARAQLSPAFSEIFDVALVQAHERLVAEPADAGAKVDFVTTYHMVIEGTLGLTAFNFIVRYLEREALLPGFVEGYSKIHHDEQRHIALRHLVPARGGARDARARRKRPPDAAGAVARGREALAPPDREGTDWDALGAGSEEIRDFALAACPAASRSSACRSTRCERGTAEPRQARQRQRASPRSRSSSRAAARSSPTPTPPAASASWEWPSCSGS